MKFPEISTIFKEEEEIKFNNLLEELEELEIEFSLKEDIIYEGKLNVFSKILKKSAKAILWLLKSKKAQTWLGNIINDILKDKYGKNISPQAIQTIFDVAIKVFEKAAA